MCRTRDNAGIVDEVGCMNLLVGPLEAVNKALVEHQPIRVISLLSPTQDAPRFAEDIPHLCLFFNDIAEPREGYIAPNEEIVNALLEFGKKWEEPEPMLVHCWMGISRSTAAAMILTCALAPERNEQEIAQALRNVSPSATPNPLMIAIADSLLERNGRMIRAISEIGRGAEASIGTPFLFPIRSHYSKE